MEGGIWKLGGGMRDELFTDEGGTEVSFVQVLNTVVGILMTLLTLYFTLLLGKAPVSMLPQEK
jgi:hypothetical protein